MEEENESQQKELEGFIAARQKESSGFALELEAAQARAAQAAGEVIRKTEEIRILRARQEEERIRQEKRAHQAGAGKRRTGIRGRRTGARRRRTGARRRRTGARRCRTGIRKRRHGTRQCRYSRRPVSEKHRRH